MVSEYPIGLSCYSELRTPAPEDEFLEHSVARLRLLGSGISATQVLEANLQRFASSPETHEAPAVLWECCQEHKSAMIRACKG